MIARLTATYVAIFAAVLAAISWVAYGIVGSQYRSMLAPALETPEGRAGYATAMHHVAAAILGADLPLLVAVAIVSYVLARVSLRPLLEAREREARFAADAAHEMRSPLATIASVAQAARLQAEEPARTAFDTIARSALDASALLGDLLTLAREPRGGALQLEAVDLANVVGACVAEFQSRASEHGVALHVNARSAVVMGDERRLRELLRVLLDNAIRHARSEITVRSGTQRREAFLHVSDDGEGIAPDLRERIFERFFHVGDGTGLGLPIARWIAGAHHGALTLDRGPGAVFVLRMPPFEGAVSPGG